MVMITNGQTGLIVTILLAMVIMKIAKHSLIVTFVTIQHQSTLVRDLVAVLL